MYMKYFSLLIAIHLCTTVFAFQIDNNYYSYNEYLDYNHHIVKINDSSFLTIGATAEKIDWWPANTILRYIDNKGNLIWDDLLEYKSDSLSYYSEGINNYKLINDSLLVIVQGVSNKAIDVFPYFVTYNLVEKQLLYTKIFKFSGIFYTMHFSKSNTLYVGGRSFKNDAQTEQASLLMKLDLEGNIIWKKEFEFGAQELVVDFEAYHEDIIFSSKQVNNNQDYVAIGKIDTNGNLLKHKRFDFQFGGANTTSIEVKDDAIYFYTKKLDEETGKGISYLAKMDGDFNIEWDTLLQSSADYNLQPARFKLLNEQLIIMGNKNPVDEPNFKGRGFISSWSLNGELNWEHLLQYSPQHQHYIDDVVGLPNGDLIFLGTLFGPFNGEYDQVLWLFRTDSLGCGTVQETCYNTLDQYFGKDTMVNIVDFIDVDTSYGLQILGNPFNEVLRLKSNSNSTAKQQLNIYNAVGVLVYSNKFTATTTINTLNWQSGIYFAQLLQNNTAASWQKVIKQ